MKGGKYIVNQIITADIRKYKLSPSYDEIDGVVGMGYVRSGWIGGPQGFSYKSLIFSSQIYLYVYIYIYIYLFIYHYHPPSPPNTLPIIQTLYKT